MIENELDMGLFELILGLTELVLTEHYLEFNGSVYKQVRGTAMGNNFDVVYTCLFLYFLEKQVPENFDTSGLMSYKHYVDDAFSIRMDYE